MIQKRLKELLPLFGKHRSWLIPVTAALLGTLLCLQGISRYKERLGYDMKTISVLVSARNLELGHVLEKDDFDIQAIPQKFLPLGGVRLEDRRTVVGQPITRPMAAGELFLWPSIDTGLGPSGPARRIAKGYRAISLQVDAVSSVAQAIRPEDHVDLIVTGQFPGNDRPMTLTLLQNVAVFNVGQEGGSPLEPYTVLSLMVLPKEVPLISHAAQNGTLRFVLRNPTDHQTPQDLPMVSIEQVMESAFRNSLQEERNSQVEVIKGGKVSIDP